MIPYILGVDPGYISGWALVDPTGKPLAWGQTGTRSRRTTGHDVYHVMYEECQQRPLVLAVEGQFLKDAAGRGGADRAKALGTLKTARMRGMWECMAEQDDVELFAEDGVQANVWRSATWGGRWTHEQAKVHAVEMALHTWGIRILKTHHHTAEALWIASYAHGELAAQRRQGTLEAYR